MLRRPNLLLLLSAALLGACANPGSGPDGGPYDETPPRVVAMTPRRGQTNVERTRRVTLLFDEAIKLDNAAEKVVVSPPQTETPDIQANGRRITVELQDTLRPNTTYTIDFADAIQDATEGNPFGDFTYYFSTGATVDTMEVAGYVLLAQNLEPQKGYLVGLYSGTADSLFRTKPLERVARTDSRGRFSIKGVRNGTYRIFALKDMDGDFMWSPGEALAFTPQTVTTSSFPDVRFDTAWVDTIRWDSISVIPYTHYKPDDVVLLAFAEQSRTRDLLKAVRDEPNHFTTYFTAPSDVAPTISGEDFDATDAFLADANATNDTITYWIRRPELAASDSLTIYYTYEATNDSTAAPYLKTDTLELRPKVTNAFLRKQAAQDSARWAKQLARRHKHGDYSQETPPPELLKLKERFPATLVPTDNPSVTLEEPIVALDTSAVHLYLREDSLLTPAPFELRPAGLMGFSLFAEWRPGQKYKVEIDSLAITGFSGKRSGKVSRTFTVATAESVGSLFLTLAGADTTAVVQLLLSDTRVASQARVSDGRADFYYLKPGDYYLRLFYDANGNGRWDTGDFRAARQPERVVYYPEKISIRANWDTELAWDTRALPTLRQKPAALTKAKAATKKQTAHAKNVERLRKKKD